MTYTAPEFPLRIEIELVSDCNLRCTYCPRHHINNLKGYMDYGLYKKIIKQIEPYSETILVLHRRGESMLHPRFVDMLNLIAGKFKEVQMATNGTVLSHDKYESLVRALDFLSFSLDPPATYNKVRLGANYEKVESKILQFLEYNHGRVKIQASMVKTETTTEENCELFKKIWNERVDRVRIYDEHSTDGNFGSLKDPRSVREPCVMPIYEMLVYCNGLTARCNHDWHGEEMGDVNTNSLKEIWHNEKYIELRRQHNKLKITDPVCSKCDSWYPEIGTQGTGEVVEK